MLQRSRENMKAEHIRGWATNKTTTTTNIAHREQDSDQRKRKRISKFSAIFEMLSADIRCSRMCCKVTTVKHLHCFCHLCHSCGQRE